jgi:hypothetical protein
VEGNGGYYPVPPPNGILCINDYSTASGDKIKWARSWNVDAQVGATVEARMQCISDGHYFGSNLELSDPLHIQALYLKANGMIGLNPTRLQVTANTADWHTYRVTIRGSDLNVYVDGDTRPALPAEGFFLSLRPEDTPQRLLFGSGSSAGTQHICYDYIHWTTQGAFAPTQWWPAHYSGNDQHGTITAAAVPFNQLSSTLDKIRFSIDDAAGRTYESPIYNVSDTSPTVWADFDNDDDVDQSDFGLFQACLAGSGLPYPAGCGRADADSDNDVDEEDLDGFLECMAGPGNSPGC